MCRWMKAILNDYQRCWDKTREDVDRFIASITPASEACRYAGRYGASAGDDVAVLGAPCRRLVSTERLSPGVVRTRRRRPGILTSSALTRPFR